MEIVAHPILHELLSHVGDNVPGPATSSDRAAEKRPESGIGAAGQVYLVTFIIGFHTGRRLEAWSGVPHRR